MSQHLNQIIHLKQKINDDHLRKHHLSSKGLGDDLYFLTESSYRQKGLFKNKYSMTDFITPKALHQMKNKNKRNLVFEHMVPKNIYLKVLTKKAKAGALTQDEIYNVLMIYYYTCTVTKDEDKLLPRTKMQEGWDYHNPFYRYQYATIDFVENPHTY